VWAEASTVLRAVAADFFFNCWCLEIPSDNRIQHVPSGSTIMHETFDRKYSRISVLEVEAVPQSCILDWFQYCFIQRSEVIPICLSIA
jgi:hypothetical protein